MLVRIEASSTGQFQRSSPTTDMKLVDRCQVFQCEAVQIFTRFFQRRQNDIPYVRAGIVRLDDLIYLIWHSHTPERDCVASFT